MLGGKEFGVDTATEDCEVFEAIRFEGCFEDGVGDEGCLCVLADGSHPGGNDFLEKTIAVMAAIGVKVGMERRDERDLELVSGAGGTPAKRSFGGDMDEVGAGCCPVSCELTETG